jgi:hypothetical protein
VRSVTRVGPVAFALGFAGLLPQVGALVLTVAGPRDGSGELLALCYGSLILSFLGGIWWGFAMRRGERQGVLAAAAVVPSLAALAIILGVAVAGGFILRGPMAWGLVALGSAILLTLPVDQHLTRTGEAPANWMRLRVPLSVALGVMTIATGALSAQT